MIHIKNKIFYILLFVFIIVNFTWCYTSKFPKLSKKHKPKSENILIIDEYNEKENEINENDLIYKSENIPIKYWADGEKNELKDKVSQDLDDEINVSSSTSYAFTNFYDQLNEDEKEFYNIIYKSSIKQYPDLNIKIVVSGINNLDAFIEEFSESSERFFTALAYDNPELWWIGSYQIGLNSSIKKYQYIITFDLTPEDSTFYGITNKKISKINEEIENEKKNIMNQIASMKLTTNYAILRFIHDYLITNIIYNLDESKLHIRTLYGALVEKQCVCEGYAEAFQYIAQQYGINVIIARSSVHEWNFVEMNRKWYIIDVTYDDPIIGEINLPSGYNDNLQLDYFLTGSEHKCDYYLKYSEDPDHILVYSGYSENHVVEYPEIEIQDYVPTELELRELELIDLSNITNPEPFSYSEMIDSNYNSTNTKNTSNAITNKISYSLLIMLLLLNVLF
ncbi:hypothetical protein PIROE2DRAFT_7251 [Piromyces sp. E2]|nr:hypothetical protein PIROE2DRAFT_7251 [Piromyces sp. E2]|eukprot:OUM65669.1 hypothetical protein PIROE2DRAFT_7251 [Piromyces sp. E2]